MNIVNRRNALLGWAVWTVAKGVAKRKAKSAVPASNGHGTWQKKVAVGAAAGAALAGAAVLLRKRGSDDDGAEPAV
jgi:hypothetical protein